MEVWLPRIEAAQVIVVGGGNERYLIKVMRESSFAEELPRLLETRLYVGISAGAMVTGKLLTPDANVIVYPEEQSPDPSEQGLDLVNLSLVPHIGSENFPACTPENLEKVAALIDCPLYGLDDASALSVSDGIVEKVEEGDLYTYNM